MRPCVFSHSRNFGARCAQCDSTQQTVLDSVHDICSHQFGPRQINSRLPHRVRSSSLLKMRGNRGHLLSIPHILLQELSVIFVVGLKLQALLWMSPSQRSVASASRNDEQVEFVLCCSGAGYWRPGCLSCVPCTSEGQSGWAAIRRLREPFN